MDAQAEYTGRRERWHSTERVQEQLFIRIGNWRLLIGIAEAVLAYLVFGPHLAPAWTLAIPVVAFIGLAVWHSKVLRRKTLAGRALTFYDSCLARLDNRWSSKAETGGRFQNPAHVYADDLDLFGKGSLFQLLSNSRTTAGEQMLADWLLAPASHAEALSRQSAVAELSTRLDLREDLALLGEDIQASLSVRKLEDWGSAPIVRFSPSLRVLAAILGTVSTLSVFAFFAQAVRPWQLLALLGCDALIILALRSRVDRVLQAAETHGHSLQVFSLLLERLERESFSSPHLQRLRASLDVEGTPASARTHALSRWMDYLDSSDHLLVKAIRQPLLWREQIAMGLESWRSTSGPFVGTWLRAIAEFEALSSLATIAYERPQWRFPTLLDCATPTYEGSGLKHPLIPPSQCVANDVAFNEMKRLLIVSGSNMSGKSTLLRAVGLNAVLAWAGAPVAASSLRIAPLSLGASIRVTDSLLDNRSRFFAEISRLREIVELKNGLKPVLFLFDELLSGTNSHDRRIGASAIVTSLVRGGAIGLITTHDLALADIANDLGSLAENVHFDDRIENGQIEFDYRLHPGLVTHSNALELMRAIGLQV